MLAAIGDDPILWVNVKTLEPDGRVVERADALWNQALVEAAARYPNIQIYDWAAVVQDAWFQDDRIHYTSAGNAERARLIADALLRRTRLTRARAATGGLAVTPPRYPDPIADHAVLEAFSPAVRAWFATSFPEPTAAQQQGWPPIAAGEHTLICAPDRQRQDARRLPVGHRLAGHHAAARGPHPPHPGALHLAAAGPRVRRREEPARPARGHRPRRRAPRRGRRHARGRHAHRRHARPATASASSGGRPTC